MKQIVLTIAAALALCNTASAQHLTILSSNDTHSAIMPNQDGRGGVMRTRVVMDSVRRADPNVLAVHAGDAVQGTVFFSMFRGDVEYAAIDSLGYNIIIMGNHEFDNGIEDIAKYYSRIRADKLCSNYDLTGTPCEGIFQPYVVKHVGDKRVAFMGININPKGLIADKCLGSLQYHDATEVALKLSEYLKTSGLADRVVMVSHIGHNGSPDSSTDVQIARESRYIDLIIGGHSHPLIDPSNSNERNPHIVKNLDGNDVPICQSGGQGEYLGKIDFDLATGKASFSQIAITDRYDQQAADNYPAMNAWLKPYADQADKKMNTRIATSAMAMDKLTPALGNWVCDAVSSALDVVFKKSGELVSAKINGKKIDPDKLYTLITIDYLANGGSRMGGLKKGEQLFVDTIPYGQHVINYVKQLDAKGKKITSSNKKRMRSAD